jgi:hypothetical protein
MARISKWVRSKKLKISSGKSQVIFFTPNTREHRENPQVYYEGELIPVVNIMKILGVNVDTGHNSSHQEDYLAVKGRGRLLIVKTVTGSKHSFTKEDALLTYKAFIPPSSAREPQCGSQQDPKSRNLSNIFKQSRTWL